MTALEEIFEGYYAKRECNPDPAEMREIYIKILESICVNTGFSKVADDIMGDVSLFGKTAEKMGFIAGFRMAMKLVNEL